MTNADVDGGGVRSRRSQGYRVPPAPGRCLPLHRLVQAPGGGAATALRCRVGRSAPADGEGPGRPQRGHLLQRAAASAPIVARAEPRQPPGRPAPTSPNAGGAAKRHVAAGAPSGRARPTPRWRPPGPSPRSTASTATRPSPSRRLGTTRAARTPPAGRGARPGAGSAAKRGTSRVVRPACAPQRAPPAGPGAHDREGGAGATRGGGEEDVRSPFSGTSRPTATKPCRASPGPTIHGRPASVVVTPTSTPSSGRRLLGEGAPETAVTAAAPADDGRAAGRPIPAPNRPAWTSLPVQGDDPPAAPHRPAPPPTPGPARPATHQWACTTVRGANDRGLRHRHPPPMAATYAGTMGPRPFPRAAASKSPPVRPSTSGPPPGTVPGSTRSAGPLGPSPRHHAGVGGRNNNHGPSDPGHGARRPPGRPRLRAGRSRPAALGKRGT